MGAGNVYIADCVNHRVQRWAPGASEGTTVAGGNGSGQAHNQLNFPSGIFVTSDETIYVADDSNHRVVKWQVGAPNGVAVAGGHGLGNAAHQLCPVAVALDESGDLF